MNKFLHYEAELMLLETYTGFTRLTAVYKEAMTGSDTELSYLGLGLVGEAGEVANELKRSYRLENNIIDKQKVLFELGDLFWYWIRLCDALNFDPEDVIKANKDKLTKRRGESFVS
ncbi:MazG Predicted pyrophosphatase [uncultured Caudovirales phage]|uniref:MazG Predicted pyrophosphatase n=1 Tax=uncultured Caudovirales phage TaxID=2100421 RepID=A0A6J5L336_9CAUD|nr:MazG Predicted pyrophosphatase [uncultured Caudovirales phage]